MRTMRSPANAGILLLALIALINPVRFASAQDAKKDTTQYMQLDADSMAKLKKAGDSVTFDAGDNGKASIDFYVGTTKYPAEAHLGAKGKAVFSLESFKDGDKDKLCLVLRFSRPDNDNASIMFKKLAPRISQMALTTADDIDYGANVYTGIDDGGDEPADGKVRNMWSSMGNYGDSGKTGGGKLFYVAPAYKNDTHEAKGTRGFFISAVPAPTTPNKVGIVLGLTTLVAEKK